MPDLTLPNHAYLFYNDIYSEDKQNNGLDFSFYIKSNDTVTYTDNYEYGPDGIYATYTHSVPKLKANAKKPSDTDGYNNFYGQTSGEPIYRVYNGNTWQLTYDINNTGSIIGYGWHENETVQFNGQGYGNYVYIRCNNQNSGVRAGSEFTGNYRNAYWYRTDDVSLPVQNLTGYTQGNYTCGNLSQKPGSSYSSNQIYENRTWTLHYTRSVYKLNLTKNGGFGGLNNISYWKEMSETGGWYSNVQDSPNDSTSITQLSSEQLPTRTGYSFDGYYIGTGSNQQQVIDDQGNILIESISEETTAYAQWKAKTYTVTFDLNNPTPGDNLKPEPESINSITVTYNSSYGNLLEPERYGYEFNGWYTLPNGGTKIESDTKYLIDSGSTLYAHWEKKKFTVAATIDQMSRVGIVGVSINDSNYDISVSDEFEYYTSITLHVKLSQESPQPGYEWKFTGWSVNNQIIDGSNVIDYPVKVEGDTTYKANITQGVKSYTVTIQSGVGVDSVRLGHKEGYNEVWEDTLSKSYIYGLDIIADVLQFTGSDYANPDAEHPWTGEDANYRYEWKNWSSSGTEVSTDVKYNFSIKEDTTLTASCTRHSKSKVSLGSVTDGSISFETEKGTWDSENYRIRLPYNDSVWSGTKVVISATPDPGNMVDKWYVNGTEVQNGGNTLELEVPSNNVTITATFKLWEYEWEGKVCHWNDYYIFVKTDKEHTPWRVVKEIHHYINDDWKEE